MQTRSLTDVARFDHAHQVRHRVLAPCPPRAQCRVCEGRLPGTSADKTAKYRHQAENNGRMAVQAIHKGSDAYTLARRAGTYGLMALESA